MNMESEIIAIKDILSTLCILYAKQYPQNAFDMGRHLEGLLISNKITGLSPEFKTLTLNLSQNLLGNLETSLKGSFVKPRQ